MLLVLLSETTVVMSRYEMQSKKEAKIKDGGKTEADVRLSTESMVWLLSQLTVTRIIMKGRRKEAHFSNRDDISREVSPISKRN